MRPATTSAVGGLCALLVAALVSCSPLSAQAPAGVGRISGRVISKETGRAVQGAQVMIANVTGVMTTDVDGKFRSPSIPVGTYSVRAVLIGFVPAKADSVRVTAGQTAVIDLALSARVVQLAEVTVEATVPKGNKDAGLLAMQQAAQAVTDGISAEAIARSPDPDAGAAVKRVTGISLQDNKYLIVRGLGERYSNALLNGAEMPNPVVEKKVAPLDIFPASLLESVVASKTATPDKPGDFAGGSVELKTKEFPDNRVLTMNISQGFNDQTTFRNLPLAPRGGTDFFGFDNGGRNAPAVFRSQVRYTAAAGSANQTQQLLQGYRYTTYDAPLRRALPNLGFGVSYGDQKPIRSSALGYIFSLTYNNKEEYLPSRLYNFYYLGREGKTSVDWGAIGNLSARLGTDHKISLKTLYTRSTTETTRYATGGETVTPDAAPDQLLRFYQLQYLERALYQLQLAGESSIRLPFNSSIEWKATVARADISDPDNHRVLYTTGLGFDGSTDVNGSHNTRYLADKTYAGQIDWSFPLSLRGPQDALFKVGGLYRYRDRSYDSFIVGVVEGGGKGSGLVTANSGITSPASLGPNQVFSPEYLGTFFQAVDAQQPNDNYTSIDKLAVGYGMTDVELIPKVRLVGGVRLEQWKFGLRPGGNNPLGQYRTDGTEYRRNDLDPLWSANLTIQLSDQMNVRLAATRTLVRPEAREISPGLYSPINGIGGCAERGDTSLVRTRIKNFDARWELYPGGSDLFAVSAFYKEFDKPIIDLRTVGAATSAGAACTTRNGDNANLKGLEFEVRKGIGFLGGPFRDIQVGANVTVVRSGINIPQALGIGSRQFIGQSPFLINGFVSYTAGSTATVSVLYNYFGDRLFRYANASTGNGGTPEANPSLIERGRGALDAKASFHLTPQLRWSIGARNLTRETVLIIQDAGLKLPFERYNPGRTFSTSFSYDF